MSQNRAGQAWYDLGGRDAGLRQALDKAEADIKRSGQVAEAGFAASMSKIGGGLSSVGSGLQSTGRALLTNLTLPLLAAGGAATKFALDFDTTMRRVVGLTDVTADQIGKIKQDILDLAPAVGKGPQELAEAFYFVASAGFKAEEAMEVLRVAAESSASGLGTTQTIAQVLGGVLNAYGKENISAARAADILTEAVSQGTAEADAFANVIGNVVPGAAALGVSFDQVTASLAGMTLVGIGAEEAATSLGQIFNSLLKPTSEAEEALRSMGLSSAGLRQELREKGLLSTLRTLDTAFAGNATAASLVFGNIRALRGVNALLSLDQQQLAAVFEKVNNSLGRQAEAYRETEGPQRDMARAMADIQVTAIQLGDDVLPLVALVLADIAGAARNLRKWWESLDEATQKNIVQWLAWVAIAGPVLLIAGKIVSALGAMFTAVSFLAGAKGVPALTKAISLARIAAFGWIGALALLVIGLDKALDAATSFFLELQHGKEGAKDLQALAEMMGNAAFATQLFAWGISAKEFATAIEAAGGDAELAFKAIQDAAGDLDAALLQLRRDSGEAFIGPDILGPFREQLIGFGQAPAELAAELKDGKFVVKPAAEEGIVDPIQKALDDAVLDAGKKGQAMIDALASQLADGPEELKDELKALREALEDPYTKVERIADLQTNLASKVVLDNLRSSDPQTQALAAQQVENWLKEYELLAPGALAEGKGINPALKQGISTNLNALLTYIRTIPATNISDAFDLADVLEGQGQNGLAGYVRGLEMTRLGAFTAELTTLQRDVHEKFDINLRQSGEASAESYADGIANKRQAAIDAAAETQRRVARTLAFSAYQGGISVVASWVDGMRYQLDAEYRQFVAKVGMYSQILGESLPKAGPLQHPDSGGRSIAAAWADSGLVSGLLGFLPQVKAAAGQFNDALNVTGGSVALGALAGAPASARATQAVAGAQTQIVNHYYQLTSDGRLVTGSAEDEVDALRRLAQLRVG